MSSRTRGTVNEETFKKVKELQKMGASIARTGRFVGLSPATTSRMYNNDTFENYREFVSSISSNKMTLKNPKVVDVEPVSEVRELINAVIRLAEAIEDSNTKKKSLW